MFEVSDNDERECIQIDSNLKQGSSNACRSSALSLSAASPNSFGPIVPPDAKKPGRRLVIVPALAAPWASPDGTLVTRVK
jgi:hypothetical protein